MRPGLLVSNLALICIAATLGSSPARATPMFQVLGMSAGLTDPNNCGGGRIIDVSNNGDVLVNNVCGAGTGQETEAVFTPAGMDRLQYGFDGDGSPHFISPDGSVIVGEAFDGSRPRFEHQVPWQWVLTGTDLFGPNYVGAPLDEIGEAAIAARGGVTNPICCEDGLELALVLGLGDAVVGLELGHIRARSPDGSAVAGTAPGDFYTNVEGTHQWLQVWTITGIPVPEPSTTHLLATMTAIAVWRRFRHATEDR